MEYLRQFFVKRNLLPAFICAVLIVVVEDIKIYFFNSLATWVDGHLFILNIPLWFMIFLACAGLLHWRGLGLVSIEEKQEALRERNQLRQLLDGLRERLGNDLIDIGSRQQVLAEGVIGVVQTTEKATVKLIAGVNQVHADTRDLLTQLQRARDLAVALLDEGNDNRAGFTATMKYLEKINLVLGKVASLTSLTDTIEKISMQTHVFALKAASEVSRVGETGQGFYPVAEKILTLSTEIAHAARQIARDIEDIRAAVSFDRQALDQGTSGDHVLMHIDGIRSSILLIMRAFVDNTTQSQTFLQRIETQLIELNSEFQFQDIVSQQLHATARMLGQMDGHLNAVATFLYQPNLEACKLETYPTLREMSDQLGFLCDLNEDSKSRHSRDRSALPAGAIELF